MKYLITFAVIFGLGIGYMAWLDAGCEPLNGVMTEHGKKCVQAL